MIQMSVLALLANGIQSLECYVKCSSSILCRETCAPGHNACIAGFAHQPTSILLGHYGCTNSTIQCQVMLSLCPSFLRLFHSCRTVLQQHLVTMPLSLNVAALVTCATIYHHIGTGIGIQHPYMYARFLHYYVLKCLFSSLECDVNSPFVCTCEGLRACHIWFTLL